ncbi:hypothetical protein ACS15_1056 [Ralstonia insidiosa]|uniref:Uncharacterized protein n=1 Tax=Ralstonia insidiosa TaxID=190721 RepID=A0AAC9BHI9_9RALS|nr:hypothetical protein ACS15_1056 [Ralstonia insidiosa]
MALSKFTTSRLDVVPASGRGRQLDGAGLPLLQERRSSTVLS